MNIYSTSDIAKIIGIHPNTVRFYEDMQLITKKTVILFLQIYTYINSKSQEWHFK